jgi:hypothetical protein
MIPLLLFASKIVQGASVFASMSGPFDHLSSSRGCDCLYFAADAVRDSHWCQERRS